MFKKAEAQRGPLNREMMRGVSFMRCKLVNFHLCYIVLIYKYYLDA